MAEAADLDRIVWARRPPGICAAPMREAYQIRRAMYRRAVGTTMLQGR